MYDAANKSAVTLAEGEAMVGKTAELHLTGKIVEAGATEAGTFVKFEVDERWGFPPGQKFVMDADAFTNVGGVS